MPDDETDGLDQFDEGLNEAEGAAIQTVKSCISSAFNAATTLRHVCEAKGKERAPQSLVVLEAVVCYMRDLADGVEEDDPSLAERVHEAASELGKLHRKWEIRGIDL
jgi:hypothetical protein